MRPDDETMTDDMAQAIREVVNFSRYDEKYQALARFDRHNATRKEYFEERLSHIADANLVDKEELRGWLKHYLKPANFGLEVREYAGSEYVVKM